MKLRKIALATSLVLSSSMAFAGVSGNVGVSSDYFWRGITQGGNSATVSGGLDYSHDSGVYVGTWVADLNGETEVDLYGGFSGEAAGIGYDIGYIYYHYPLQWVDFSEAYIGLSYMGADLYVYQDLSDDTTAETSITLSYSYEVKKNLSLGLTVAHVIDEDTDNSYSYANPSIDTKMGEWDASFALNVTDIEDDKPVPFVTISRGFDL